MYFIGGIAPHDGFFIFPTFLTVFEKNLKFWKKYKNCFVDFSTYSKDTSGGSVPFDSALNVLPREYSPPRWDFVFPTFFMVFENNQKFEKNTKNCFVDLSTYSKDTSRGLVPFYLALNVLPRGIAPHAGFFIFPTFLMVFGKNLKIWKNTKIVLSISPRIVNIRVRGWYHSIQH